MEYQTRGFGHITLALFMGAAAAGLLIGGLTYAFELPGFGGGQRLRETSFSLLVAISVFIAFFVGMIVIASPLWTVLHKFGYRRLLHAVVLSAALTFFVSFSLETLITFSGPPGFPQRYEFSHPWETLGRIGLRSGILSILGVVAGSIVWRMSYLRRSTP